MADSDFTPGMSLATSALFGAGAYCMIELFVMIGYSFQRWHGLYFWSLVLASIAQTLQIISSVIQVYGQNATAELAIGIPGYVTYILFEYLALYSRLYILSASKSLLRWTLIIVFIELITIELPYAGLVIETTIHPRSLAFPIFKVWVQLEAVVYLCMDVAFSTIYIVHIVKRWGLDESPNQRRVFRHLIYMAIINVLIDIAYVTLSYVLSYNLLSGFNVG
jgi:hypothetical protein